jgi:hypothetical protein
MILSVNAVSCAEQTVVDYLEKIGFDVTFVYFGGDNFLTFGAEDCALVVMSTDVHIKNFQFTSLHEQQFMEGKNALNLAFPDAEVFMVFLFEDLDKDGLPDVGVNGFYEASGAGHGGRTETAFSSTYWETAHLYVKSNWNFLPTFSEPHNEYVNSSTLSVAWQTTIGVEQYLVRLDDNSWNLTYRDSFLFSGLVDGVHCVELMAIDEATGRLSETAKVEVVIDTILPDLEFIAPPENTSVEGIVVIEFKAADENFDCMDLYIANEFKQSYNQGQYCFSWDTAEYEDGPTLILLKAYDLANNFAQRTLVVSVDNKAPTSAITSLSNNTVLEDYGDSFLIAGSAFDAGSSIGKVEISFDNGATWNLTSGGELWSYVWDLPKSSGEYTIKIRATDTLNHIEEPIDSWIVTIVWTEKGLLDTNQFAAITIVLIVVVAVMFVSLRLLKKKHVKQNANQKSNMQ